MNAPATSPLIFNWSGPRGRNLAIAGFIAASFALHLVSFYLFQVVYPPTVSLLPSPQRVNLLTATSEQTATLLRWIDAEDPALISATRRPPHAQRHEIGRVEHVPSYFAVEPALKEPPPLTVDLRLPSVAAPGPVPMQTRGPVVPPKISPTQVTFSNELRELGSPNFANANFKASLLEPPQSARFRVAVDGGGAVRYCFILNSSGDPALDKQAREHLALCRFAARPIANSEALVWGIATIEWGNDVVQPNSKSTPIAP
jgi:hypothetical protein